MRLDEGAEQQYEVGNAVTVSVFAEEKYVDVVGKKTQSARLDSELLQ